MIPSLHISLQILTLVIFSQVGMPQLLSEPKAKGPKGRFYTNADSSSASQSVFSHLGNELDPPLSGTNGARPDGSDCVNRDISQCTELLEVLTKKELTFGATRKELNEMCPVLLKGLQCIDNYTLRCMNPQHRSYFNELYAGTSTVIKDLCDTRGHYQKEYIRHAPCLRKTNPKYNVCSESYHAKTAKLNQVNSAIVEFDENQRRRNVITLCCSFQEYLQCSERAVFEKCGNLTAKFTKQFLHRMAGPIVQTKCLRYEPGSYICETSASGTSTLSSLWWSGLLLPSAVFSFSILTNSWLKFS